MVADDPGARLLQAIGARVRARRRDRGMTAALLAENSGLSRRFLAELEAGRSNVSIANLARIARALSTSVAALVDEPGARTIALLGLRGAGKSTVGAALGRKLGVPFVELDALVEEAAGLPIAEIFAVHGENHFRRLEARALEEFLARSPTAVLATGGGLVNARETFDLLRRGAFTVWLRARPEDHMDRVVRQGDSRPIARSGRASAMAQLRQILVAREPLYAQADLTLDTSNLTPREVVLAIEDEVRRRGEAA
jgi:XRE family transcriptional regulator, aerobic/anaerobic benzoate catabolism transcriptional regulator